MAHFRDRRAFGNVNGRRFRGARYGDGKSPRFTGLLDLYGGASAAYSLRALSTGWLAGDVVEVRRDSDSTSQDFTASQITNGAMVDWVSDPFSVYISDFSVDVDGFTTTANGTTSGNQSIGGVDDALKFTLGGAGGATQFLRTSGFSGNGDKNIRIRFDVYIPSQIYTDTIRVTDNTGGNYVNVTPMPDTWVSVDDTFTAASGSNRITFRCFDGTLGNIDSLASGEEVYIKNVSVDYINADGFVSTWYDQSGNANDATQATTTSQPKIVDAGALVTGGLEFDGVDDFLGMTLDALGTSSRAIFAACSPDTSSSASLINLNDSVSSGTSYGVTTEIATRCSSVTWESSSPASGLSLVSSLYTSGNIHTGLSMFLDGSSVTRTGGTDGTIDTTGGNANIGAFGSGSPTKYDGRIAEIIVYNSDESANRVGIETNINDYYQIF